MDLSHLTPITDPAAAIKCERCGFFIAVECAKPDTCGMFLAFGPFPAPADMSDEEYELWLDAQKMIEIEDCDEELDIAPATPEEMQGLTPVTSLDDCVPFDEIWGS